MFINKTLITLVRRIAYLQLETIFFHFEILFTLHTIKYYMVLDLNFKWNKRMYAVLFVRI